MMGYVIVVKDNFAPAMEILLQEKNSSSWLTASVGNNDVVTFVLSVAVILPLCMLRDLKPLERFSFVKIVVLVIIAVTLLILLLQSRTQGWRDSSGTNEASSAASMESDAFYRHWIQVRPGLVRNMGTFVSSLTANHTVHLIFFSLPTNLQSLRNWEKVSTISTLMACSLILPFGVFPYMTFWEATGTNLFLLYPQSNLVDASRLLLSLAMLLTFPMPFFSCRELIVSKLPSSWLEQEESRQDETETRLMDSERTTHEMTERPPSLRRVYHWLVTIALWSVTVALALSAPSLGDVLNFFGCATGTMVSFVLPGLFAFRLRGFSMSALFLLIVGGVVGSVGTCLSLLHIFQRISLGR
jgi:amino acid permease